MVVPLNGGEWCDVVLSLCLVLSPVLFAVFPVFELDPASRIVQSSFALLSLVLCCLLSLCVAVVCAENGRVVCVVCVVLL